MFQQLPYHFIISCVLLTGISADFHNILPHVLFHVSVPHHGVAATPQISPQLLHHHNYGNTTTMVTSQLW